MPKKILLIAATLVLLAALATGAYLYLNKGQAPEAARDAAEKLSQSAGQGVLPAIGTNPLENKPNLNPVDKTNPFNDIKTNPFK